MPNRMAESETASSDRGDTRASAMGLTSARWAVGVVIAALLCASSVDARALRAELDVGVTDIVATEGSNEPIARARDQVLADADEAGSSSTDDAAAAVETRSRRRPVPTMTTTC